jgi:HEAT repeat protein
MPLIRKTAEPKIAPEENPALAGILETGSVEERWAAARAAADAPSGARILGEALLREKDMRVREAIFTSLVRIGSEACLDAIVPHLRSDDPNLRTGALDALRAMPKAVTPRVRLLLQDPDPDVRLLACDLARAMPSTDANAVLCELLDSEQSANVCGVAVDVLAETAVQECLPALARCAARFPHDPFLVFSIKIARERIASQTEARRAGDLSP